MTGLAVALPLNFDEPRWLWLGLLVPALVLASLRSLAGLDPVRRVASLVVRSLVVLLIVFALAGVEVVRRNDDLTVMFLMDRSHSVESLQAQQEDFVRAATEHMPADDRVGLIDFARNAFLQQLPMRGYFVPPGRLPVMSNPDRTDVASAMRLAMAMFPHDAAKRIVLMSDGNDNMGDVIGEARRAKADGIPVDVVPLWYRHRNEVYFDRMIAPAYAEPGEQVTVRMVLHSDQRLTGMIAIRQNGRLIDLPEESRRVSLAPGPNTFFIKLPVDTSGTQTYEASFRPDDASMDAVSINNTASAFTFVSGKSRALLITSDPRQDTVLLDALQSEHVQVEMRSVSDLGEFGLLQMMNYATIILSNIPAAAFTEQQQSELTVYVRDMGSGLIMTGGDNAFGAGGWIGSPVEEVMPVTFEIKHKRVIPRGALVLIMHSCEIPRGNYWGKEMAKKSVDTISSRDYIGVVAYSFSPGGHNWEVPFGENDNRAAVKARIDRMQIGDMPDFATSMQMTLQELTTGVARDAAQKHVIILSDGDAQPPHRGLLAAFAQAKVTVSTIAIGWGAHVNEATMRTIAQATGGKHYSARNPKQLPQIFVKESKTVRRPLIIDEAFRPQVLDGYSELLAGIDPGRDALPPLGGMVLTSAKEDPNVLIPIIRATDDGNDPVLAHWQCELGKAVAFTSGYWPVWGEVWSRWTRFAKFWAQLVRWTMRQETPANFDTYAHIEGSRGRIVIDALDKDASYLNNLRLRAKIIGPDREAIPIQFTQRGPGNYQAEFDAEKAGQYLTSVQILDQGRPLGTVRTGVSVPFSPEYRDLVPNEALLRRVAEITGGNWLDVPGVDADVFRHDLPPTEAKRPAWEWVVAWLLLPAFLLDVSVRRLASSLALSIAVEIVVLFVVLFGLNVRYGGVGSILGAILFAELIGWTIRFRHIAPLFEFLTHGVTALAHAGDRSAVSLEKLKETRERVRGDLAAKEAPPVDSGADSPSAPRRRAKRRYDVGEGGGAAPAGDLDEALGGAQADAGPTPARPPGAKDDQPEQTEGTTSRLLRAKRRKRPDDE